MIVVIIIDDKVEEVLLAQQDEQNGFGEKLNAEARVEVAFHFCWCILCIYVLNVIYFVFLKFCISCCVFLLRGGSR